MAVSKLKLSGRNPRRGNLEAIKNSLVTFGFFRPIVVNRRTMEVLIGNHTLRAARALGWKQVDVYFVDVDDDCARRIALADNRTSDLAGYDQQELADLLLEVGDLAGTGFEQPDLDALLDDLSDDLPLPDDFVPPLQDEPRTKPGDLIRLGEHRLLCGDACDLGSYRRLVSGATPTLMWTDPPYGVDYTGKTSARLTIRNDNATGLEHLLTDSFACIDLVLAPGSPIYVCHPAGRQAPVFLNAFVAQGWDLRQTLVWAKHALVLGRSDYHYRHEPLLYGFKPGSGRLGRGGNGWFGDNSQASVFELPRPHAAREHPTTKPPELVAIALRNSSRRGAVVLDPFAGSGATLVACEQLGRRARLLEIDASYCDVIIERFERLTGARATREEAS